MSQGNIGLLIFFGVPASIYLGTVFIGYLAGRSANKAQIRIAEAKAREAEAQAKPADPGPDNK